MMETSIDPQLRDHAQSASQTYPYPLNPIRLPPPQQHHAPQHPWPAQPDAHLYYPHRPGQHAPNLPQPDTPLHHDATQQQPDQPLADSKRPRACEACRGLKVRCEPDPVKGTCRRCAKAGRHCVVTAPSRKRQKKTDSRVAELEKKIDALTASLHATRAQAVSDSDDDSADDRRPLSNPSGQSLHPSDFASQEAQRMAEKATMIQPRTPGPYSEQPEHMPYPSTTGNDRKRRRSQYHEENSGLSAQESQPRAFNDDAPIHHPPGTTSGSTYSRPVQQNGTVDSMPATTPNSISPSQEYTDVVDRKILDAALASEMFEYYVQKMAGHMPLVVFPPETPAGAIRKHRPILFLAILSVASGQTHPDIQRVLAKEIMRAFADQIIYKGEKSLELIQALQVLTIWHWPEENREVQTYQLIHMAAVMAIDIGLGKHVKGGREPYHALWKNPPRAKMSSQASESPDSRRAWLGCYLLCASAAMGLRRTNLIRWNSQLDECLNFLNTSPEALPSDSVLVDLVRLQRLADDVGNQISADDSSSVGLPDVKTQYALKGFERQMKDWEQQTSKQINSMSLPFNFHAANLYMHEFAMHLDQTLEYPGSSRQRENQEEKGKPRPEVLTTAHVGALTTCLTSIHGMFDTFLRSTAEDIRTVPVYCFVRVAYATVLLIKMYFAATSPDSEFGKVISSDDMRVEDYIRRLRELLQAGGASGRYQPAHCFALAMSLLQTWFERRKDGQGNLFDEGANSKRIEAQPVDVEKQAAKGEYKRMQLSDDTTPARRSSMAGAAPPAGAEGMDQSRLHVLGEVALGNSSSNGPGMKASNDHWNAYSGAATGGPANACVGYDYGTTMAPVGTAGYDGEMHGFQPGLGQAMGMTFNEGNLSYMDDYALYNMMQLPTVVENMT
ncbi:MAG: hypothetical protein Q9179_003515 [Wetmoreana sp. 5 TL-2023]